MIYSSFFSNDVAYEITVICLSILLKTRQSWKTLYSLLSIDAEKILNFYNDRGTIDFHFSLYQPLKITQREIYEAKNLLNKVFKTGWHIAYYGSEYYPSQWIQLKNQAPPLIFFKGTPRFEDRVPIAVVGTTKPTHNCANITKELVRWMEQYGGYHISGGAPGVDSIGHETAIRLGCISQAILPYGIFHYPLPPAWEEAICENRMQIISPWLPTVKWSSSQAVRRNLFIATIAKIGCLLKPSHQGGSYSVGRNLLSRELPVFIYKPRGFASALRYLPEVYPLVDSQNKINYELLNMAIAKVKNLQPRETQDLFILSDRSEMSDLSDFSDKLNS